LAILLVLAGVEKELALAILPEPVGEAVCLALLKTPILGLWSVLGYGGDGLPVQRV